jgi:large subunit ribosomal protein L29
MKISEIRALSTDALHAKLNDAREELMKLRFQQASGSLTDTTRLLYTRRDIAKMSTVLTEREADKEGAK